MFGENHQYHEHSELQTRKIGDSKKKEGITNLERMKVQLANEEIQRMKNATPSDSLFDLSKKVASNDYYRILNEAVAIIENNREESEIVALKEMGAVDHSVLNRLLIELLNSESRKKIIGTEEQKENLVKKIQKILGGFKPKKSDVLAEQEDRLVDYAAVPEAKTPIATPRGGSRPESTGPGDGSIPQTPFNNSATTMRSDESNTFPNIKVATHVGESINERATHILTPKEHVGYRDALADTAVVRPDENIQVVELEDVDDKGSVELNENDLRKMLITPTETDDLLRGINNPDMEIELDENDLEQVIPPSVPDDSINLKKAA